MRHQRTATHVEKDSQKKARSSSVFSESEFSTLSHAQTLTTIGVDHTCDIRLNAIRVDGAETP